MVPEVLQGNALWESLFALGVFALSILASLLVVLIFNRLLKLLTSRTRTALDDLLVKALSRPIFLLVLVQGFFIALTSVTFLDRYQPDINKAWPIVIIAVVGYAVQRVAAALLTWYGQAIAGKSRSGLDARLLPILRRIVVMVIFAITLVIILDELHIAISPLIAGLGIGGLAVALALQPTLTNFIASAYIVSEGRLGVGDRIQVEGGPTGTIEDIGWRTTKLRSPQNNLVIIPNSKLADSIITNFQAPQPAIVVTIACGVSYESDLEQVRQVTLEVLQQVINESEEAIKDFEPLVRFFEFGDSNINFRAIFQAKDFGAQFTLTDVFISRLHQRFLQEGIEINYPVRKLVYSQQDGVRPEGLDRRSNLDQGPKTRQSRLPELDNDASPSLADETTTAADAPDF